MAARNAVSLARLAEMDERPLLIGGDHVGQSVAVEIDDGDLAADARIVVDLVRNESHAVVLVAPQLEPVDDGGSVWLDVPLGAMRPDPLARDDVLEPVAVDVDEVEGVELADAQLAWNSDQA